MRGNLTLESHYCTIKDVSVHKQQESQEQEQLQATENRATQKQQNVI